LKSNEPKNPGPETDPRFPSGEWIGFFLQPAVPGRHWMEMHLSFRNGVLKGEGRDWVGEFTIWGRYHLNDGRCWWTKSYIDKHTVDYRGYNEGKGIWGTWQMYAPWRGGFRIWPVAMGDPTLERLEATEEIPIELVAGAGIVAEPVGLTPTGFRGR
jgi:hypothetical protein